MSNLDKRCEFVTQLFAMINKEGIRIHDEAKTNNFLMTQAQSTLKTSMQLTEDKIDENTTRFSKELDENIPKLHSNVMDVSGDLEKDIIRNTEADTLEVIECKLLT